MERVGQHASGTLYINDSKATNAEAVAPALAAFPSVRWILGGVPKTGGIKPLEHLFGHVAKAYLIGEAAGDFAGTLSANDIDFEISETLDQAVTSAHHDADANDTVLLSPACASFDQFPNFERRGDAFRDAVLALDGVTAIGPSQSNLQAENA
jgi:UDP-N-acetylmuramoylalanine--D-glutamate ligase